VQAAKEACAQHGVVAIRRTDAAGIALQRARMTLQTLIAEARADNQHTIVFVTGTPGAGKTLLGLDLVLADQVGRDHGEASAFLSGNRPLVKVLQEALLEDEADRTGQTKKSLRLKVEGALQTLLDFLRHYTSNADEVPAEHVVVFDEAQRAWDAATGQKLLSRTASEPDLFLEIMGRHDDWACMVCLIGEGQEINKGEAGVQLWADAIRKANNEGSHRWRVVAPPGWLDGLGSKDPLEAPVAADERPALELMGSSRAYRNSRHTDWLSALVDGKLAEARAHAEAGEEPPAYLTRSLVTAKDWLRQRLRGGRRVGLLASSGARRLVAEGIPPTLLSNDLSGIAHWFLRKPKDFRSSCALELALSEYGVQGLEIDYAGVCWGGDFIWNRDDWQPRKMSAPKWNITQNEDAIRFTRNTYRVLLSRCRAGQVIFVPRGGAEDRTRDPATYDRIARALLDAGVVPLDPEPH
jgi:hypothetical protein